MRLAHAALALLPLLEALPPPVRASDGSSASAPGAPEGPRPAAAAPSSLAIVDGVVRAVDLAAHRVTLEAAGGSVVLGLDRNTLVYVPAGLSTVFELRPGEMVRAGRDDRFVAFWIQVRSAPPGPGAVPSAPGQGSGPGDGTAAPPEHGGAPPAPAPAGRAPAASSPGPG